jgi:hypothetical protein
MRIHADPDPQPFFHRQFRLVVSTCLVPHCQLLCPTCADSFDHVEVLELEVLVVVVLLVLLDQLPGELTVLAPHQLAGSHPQADPLTLSPSHHSHFILKNCLSLAGGVLVSFTPRVEI